jgi:hypothetical protein
VYVPVLLAKSLSVVVTISLVPLPPDPGEAGKATLEGIDSDSDGVRDDIQRYIALTYSDSEKTQAALTQYAKVTQAALLNADDKNESIVHVREVQRALECLYSFRSNDAWTTHGELQAQILNTDERSRAWISANGHVSGEVFTISDNLKSSCDFDPDSLGD